MTDTLDLTKVASLREDTKKPVASLLTDFGVTESLAPALEAIELLRERFPVSIPEYSLPEFFGKPVFPLIEYPMFPALPDIASLIDPKILEALAHLTDDD